MRGTVILARIAWHICTTIPEMMEQTGLKLDLLSKDKPVPEKAADIAHVYKAVSGALLEQIMNNWKVRNPRN